MHQELSGFQPPAVDLITRDVLAKRRHERVLHALTLHAEGVHDVGFRERVEVVGDLAAEGVRFAGNQGRWAADGHACSHSREGKNVRACDSAVENVADDPDVEAVEAAHPLPQREDVEQRLTGVLVLAVSGIDDRR